MQLARQHLPMAAQVPTPVPYTATDQIQGHRNYYGQVGGPVAITLGGCTPRTYRPDPAEQTLIDTDENRRPEHPITTAKTAEGVASGFIAGARPRRRHAGDEQPHRRRCRRWRSRQVLADQLGHGMSATACTTIPANTVQLSIGTDLPATDCLTGTRHDVGPRPPKPRPDCGDHGGRHRRHPCVK